MLATTRSTCCSTKGKSLDRNQSGTNWDCSVEQKQTYVLRYRDQHLERPRYATPNEFFLCGFGDPRKNAEICRSKIDET